MQAMDKIKIDLTSMGYRDMGGDVWGKPFGYHLICFDINKKEWTNYMKTTGGDTTVWHREKFKEKKETTFVEFLKDCEADTNITGHISKVEFNFLTIKEKAEFLLS
jgi:hypothetical protein